MNQADKIRDHVSCAMTFRVWLAAKLAPPGSELEEVILVADNWDELASRVETRLVADEQKQELLSEEIETLLKEIERLREQNQRLIDREDASTEAEHGVG